MKFDVLPFGDDNLYIIEKLIIPYQLKELFFMPNQFLRILLFSIFLLITTSNFAVESYQKANKFHSIGYSLGIGVSLSYKDIGAGSIIDTYHLIHFQSRPFDKILVKLGVGLNYDTIPPIPEMTANFSFAASIGYLYVQNQSHPLSHLTNFGVGFTVDYMMISTSSHSLGVTIYTTLNPVLLGLGGGAVIPSDKGFQPYVTGSIGIIY